MIPQKPAKNRGYLGGPATIPPASSADRPKADLGGKDRAENIFYLEIGKIKSNPHQPRKNFDKNKLQELADSIKEHGILQPLVLTKISEDNYQLIAGERRLEAAKIVGLSQVPVIIRESSEQEKLELALVENLQRDNLNPIEKAHAFKKLIDKFNFIQADVAKKVGKSREAVANTIRLLDLPAEIQRAILEEKITEGHGRVILSLPDIEKRLLFFKEILKNNLSVRQAEALLEKIRTGLPKKFKIKSRKELYLREFENKLSDALGTKVKLIWRGSDQRSRILDPRRGRDKKGKIVIEFFSKEELNGIIKKICKK